eukprot:scaffold75_cov165-Amphora_coffeaeformis.AAC.1
MAIVLESSSRAMRKTSRKPPLGVRQIELERYDPNNPFPLVDPTSKSQDVKPKVHVLTIRRETYLWVILLWLVPYIAVDTCNILPLGILFYSLGFCYVREMLSELDDNHLSMWSIEQEASVWQRKNEALQKEYDRAMFELHVMQGRKNVRVVSRNENGVTTLYAIG